MGSKDEDQATPNFLKRKFRGGCQNEVKFQTIATITNPVENSSSLTLSPTLKKRAMKIMSSFTLPKPASDIRRPLRIVVNTAVKKVKEYKQEKQTVKSEEDCSLKNVVSFTSCQTFDWCTAMDERRRREGLDFFLTGQSITDPTSKSIQGIDHTALFQSAICSWVHPEAQIPSAILLKLTTQGGEVNDFLSRRRRQWDEALSSLFHGYQESLCPSFYVSGQNNCALFTKLTAANPEGISEPVAYLSRSTRGIRALMRAQEVTFSMPLRVDDDDDEEAAIDISEEDVQELQEFERSHPGQAVWVEDRVEVADNSDKSGLCFHGVKSVRGLFQFLLKSRRLLGSSVGGDEPLLLSPAPFMWATVSQVQVSGKKLQSFVVDNAPASDKSTEPTVKHRLELRSPLLIPPWVVARVSDALNGKHHPNCTVSSTTDKVSQTFNLLVADARRPSSQT